MAKVTVTKTTLKGPFVALQPTASSLDVTFEACDASLKNQFAASGDDLLLVWNTHAADPGTFTLTSVADEHLRTGDITAYSLAAGEIGAYRIKNDGWRQSDGKIYLEGSAATIKFAVMAL